MDSRRISYVNARENIYSNISRRKFLIKLVEEIANSYSNQEIQSTPTTPTTPFQRKRALSVENIDPNSSPKRFQCQTRLCNKNKTSKKCRLCKRATCGICTDEKSVICKLCKQSD